MLKNSFFKTSLELKTAIIEDNCVAVRVPNRHRNPEVLLGYVVDID